MDFVDSLKEWLIEQSEIANLIGAGPNARIYDDLIKEGVTLPALVITESVGGNSGELLVATSRLVQGVYHLYHYGASRAKANELFEAVRINLQKAGSIEMGTTSPTWVDSVSLSGYRDTGFDKAADGSPLSRFWTRGIYFIWHQVAQVKTGA